MWELDYDFFFYPTIRGKLTVGRAMKTRENMGLVNVKFGET